MPPPFWRRGRRAFGSGSARPQDRAAPSMYLVTNMAPSGNTRPSGYSSSPDASHSICQPQTHRPSNRSPAHGSDREPTTNINHPDYCDRVRERLGRMVDDDCIKRHYVPGDRPYDVVDRIRKGDYEAPRKDAQKDVNKKSDPFTSLKKAIGGKADSLQKAKQVAKKSLRAMRSIGRKSNNVDPAVSGAASDATLGGTHAEQLAEQEPGNEHGDNNFRDSAIDLGNTSSETLGHSFDAEDTAVDSPARDSTFLYANDNKHEMFGDGFVSFGDTDVSFSMKSKELIKVTFPSFEDIQVPADVKAKDVEKFKKRKMALLKYHAVQEAMRESVESSPPSPWQINSIPGFPIIKLDGKYLEDFCNPAYSLGEAELQHLDVKEQLSATIPEHSAQLIRAILEANRDRFRLYLSFEVESVTYPAYGPYWCSKEKCIELLGMVELLGCLFGCFQAEIDRIDQEQLLPQLLELNTEEAKLHKLMIYEPAVYSASFEPNMDMEGRIIGQKKVHEPDCEAQDPAIKKNMLQKPDWDEHNRRVHTVKNSNNERNKLLDLITCSDLLEFFQELAERSDRRQFTDDGYTGHEWIYDSLNSASLEICSIIQFSDFKHNIHTCEVGEQVANIAFQDLLQKRRKTVEEARECIREGLQVVPEQSQNLGDWVANHAINVLHEHKGGMKLKDLWAVYYTAAGVQPWSYTNFELAARAWHALQLPFVLLQTKKGLFVVIKGEAYEDGNIATLDFRPLPSETKKREGKTDGHHVRATAKSDSPEPESIVTEDLPESLVVGDLDIQAHNPELSKTALKDLRYIHILSKKSSELAMNYLRVSGLLHILPEDEDEFVLLNDWKYTFPPSCPARLRTGEFVDAKDSTETTISYGARVKQINDLTEDELSVWVSEKLKHVVSLRNIVEQCDFAFQQAKIIVPDLPMLGKRNRSEFNNKSPRQMYLFQLREKLLWHRDYAIGLSRTLRKNMKDWQQQSSNASAVMSENLYKLSRRTLT